MEVVACISSLKELIFTKNEGAIYLEYNKFVSFLQKYRLESEPPVSTSNILKELRNHKDGILEINGKRVLTTSSFMRYISKHYESYEICKRIFTDIISVIFNNEKGHNGTSILDLYEQIAKYDSHFWCEDVLKTVNVAESRTLYTDYKDKFSETEWKKICIFEHHFAKDVVTYLNYEEETHQKQEYLDNLLKVKSIANSAVKKCEKAKQNNLERKNAANKINGVNIIHEGITHSYQRIDETLNKSIEEFTPEKLQCATVTCSHGKCKDHDGDVHIFVETKDVINFLEIGQLLKFEIGKKHGLHCTYIIFVQIGTFIKHSCPSCDTTGIVHRFELQEAFVGQKLSNDILHILKTCDDDYTNEANSVKSSSGVNLCKLCFNSVGPWVDDILDWRCVNVNTEWLLHVPIEVQEFFTSCFLNKESVRKCDNKAQLLQNKVPKLYCLFDTGLALYNRNYMGIIQQLNTEELASNYHSITTIFNITSNSGCTQSISTAERWLKKAADSDISYYETFLKQYPLCYEAADDDQQQIHNISLRDCHITLFMDNLVRLSVHEDPDPGKSRTSQLCTLPITIKGLPKNNKMIESWHCEDCIEKTFTDSCSCMEAKQLQKTDATLLTDNTEEESDSWKKFYTQVTWGLSTLPELESTMCDVLDISLKEPLPHIDTEDLDCSMKSLTLDDQENDEARLQEDSTSIEMDTATLDNLEQKFDQSLNFDTSLEEQQFIEEINKLQSSNIDDNPDNTESLATTILEYESHCNLDSSTAESCENTSKMNKHLHLLSEFQVPPLLCRHPIPATGRDDDISNLKDILKEMIQKLGRKEGQMDRILFAPDHKIAKNLLKLMKENPFYRQFLPEFPALHLRKSKIVNLFSAYKNAGLLHLLKFMKDSEQEDDWMKLITFQNIETASRNITRMSVALHCAVLLQFYKSLVNEEQTDLQSDLKKKDISNLNSRWGKKLNCFIEYGRSRNATFALHMDFMQHCDEIVAIATAERIGGPDGYNRLLAAVKSSLPFAFLNGASSYASFCVDLLHEHYGAGTFHQNMKKSLFSTPHKNSNVNIALDTQREMDHKDAIKGFRPRSTMQSIIPRMTIVDHYTDVQKARAEMIGNKCPATSTENTSLFDDSKRLEENTVQFVLRKADWKHILPVCKLILRVDGLSSEESIIPQNIYDQKKGHLPCEILDTTSYGIGTFLIKKYVVQQRLFGLSESDIADISSIDGPSHLVKKAKSGKSITMRRVNTRTKKASATNVKENDENKRQAHVKKNLKILDCMSSSMNTCQSLVNPDGTKASVQKSQGVRKALLKVFCSIFPQVKPTELEQTVEKEGILMCGVKSISKHTKGASNITYATMEFAGVKFKSKATSGEQYLKHIEKGILGSIFYLFPNVNTIVVCEEKYSFTPDDFKSATRKKRQKTEPVSIAHLQYGDEIMSDHKLSRSATLNTGEGKRMISKYLARNVSKLGITRDLTVIVDSELVLSECKCKDDCCCTQFTCPVKAEYNTKGFIKYTVMTDIHQRKGEAELAQVDWLQTIMKDINPGEEIVSVVTSGDIDSIVVHLFALSLHWHRNQDGTFKNTVYVLLQKMKPEMYNITDMIERIEKHFGFKYAALNIAIVCCMGGNDFLPKLNGMSHEKWMSTFLQIPDALQTILIIEECDENNTPHKALINSSIYQTVIKHMYCPRAIQPNHLTIDEVRQMSIKIPGKDFRHPTTWMPPQSAIESLIKLLNCQLEYLFTVWDHSAELPIFLGRGCLIKDQQGDVSYDFGAACRTDNKEDLLIIDEKCLLEKM